MLKLNKTLEPSWVQETLCVYPFLVYRKSFSLLGLPGISKSRFKQLMIKSQDSLDPPEDTDNHLMHIFDLFCRSILTLTQVEDGDYTLTTSSRPQTGWNQRKLMTEIPKTSPCYLQFSRSVMLSSL